MLLDDTNSRIYVAIRRRRKGRRRREDRLSVVLLIIVAVFVLCNLPRLGLNMHEITVIDQVNRCFLTDLGGFPIWALVLGFVSQVSLVVNSSTNLLIYCLVGTRFRAQFCAVLRCGRRRGCNCARSSESCNCSSCGNRVAGLKTIGNKSDHEESSNKDSKG